MIWVQQGAARRTYHPKGHGETQWGNSRYLVEHSHFRLRGHEGTEDHHCRQGGMDLLASSRHWAKAAGRMDKVGRLELAAVEALQRPGVGNSWPGYIPSAQGRDPAGERIQAWALPAVAAGAAAAAEPAVADTTVLELSLEVEAIAHPDDNMAAAVGRSRDLPKMVESG